MKFLSVLLLVLCHVNVKAQLTIGQVFDFEIGDEFHYKSNYEGPTWVERKTVIDKWWSEDSAVVNYKWKNIVSGIDPNTLENFVRAKEEVTSHSNLDSSIYTLEMNDFLYNRNSKYVTFIDSSLLDSFALTRFSIDTTIKYDSLFCFVKHQGFQLKDGQYGWGGFEGHLYGKGIGKIHYYYYYDDHSGPEIWNRDYLLYFKTGNDTCGTPDYTSIDQREEALKLVVFPNPAYSTIYLNSSKNIEYKILSSDGKLFMQGSCTVAINIATLPKGVYFLKTQSENQIQINKFIKLNSQF